MPPAGAPREIQPAALAVQGAGNADHSGPRAAVRCHRNHHEAVGEECPELFSDTGLFTDIGLFSDDELSLGAEQKHASPRIDPNENGD